MTKPVKVWKCRKVYKGAPCGFYMSVQFKRCCWCGHPRRKKG